MIVKLQIYLRLRYCMIAMYLNRSWSMTRLKIISCWKSQITCWSVLKTTITPSCIISPCLPSGRNTNLTLCPVDSNLHHFSSSLPLPHPHPRLYIFFLLSPLMSTPFSSSLDPSTSSTFSSSPVITPLSTLIFLRLLNSPAQQCYSAAY